MSTEMDELIERWLEGSLDVDEQDALLEWLKAHPDHMHAFAEASIREQMLRDAVHGMVVSEDVTDRANASRKAWKQSRQRVVALVAGLAACLLVAVVGYQASVEKLDPFSSIVLLQQVDGPLQVGDRLSNEIIDFDHGIVRLLFDDGVEVTLQGPVRYELVELGKTRLHSGLLTATVPPGAEGFRVDTRAIEVVDLGTAFGVEQRSDGTSEVTVFDGEVEVISQQDRGKRLLVEGESIRLDADGMLQETEFSTQQFEKIWPTASGIAGSTGAFQFAPPWPRRLRHVESDSKIFVLPEGYPMILDQACPVNMTGNELGDFEIPAGLRVRSFLLQFNPVDPSGAQRSGRRRNGRRIEGSITFARPVLGIITRTETLTATDALFSENRAGGLFGRGLEERPPRMADAVSLSNDRRTLDLELFVVDRLSDHVRVIVDAAINEDR